MKRRASQTQQSDNDLLTEMQAQEQELPMSLAWYPGNECSVADHRSCVSQTGCSTAAQSCGDGLPPMLLTGVRRRGNEAAAFTARPAEAGTQTVRPVRATASIAATVP